MSTTVTLTLSNAANDALEVVSRINLSPINAKLQYEDPVLWSDEAVAVAEVNYRRFLALHLMHPLATLVPNKILDEYWHHHILDTRKYDADCKTIFGSFLHHDPYFGIEGEEDRQMNIEAFTLTQQLWEEAFGLPLLGKSNPCSTTDCR